MTGEEWDTHWYRIRDDHARDGGLPVEAAARAEVETTEQFGPRPGGQP